MARLFDPHRRAHSERNRETYAKFEIVYTVVDFLAAGMFFVGSVLFFWAATQTAGVWLFVIGSLFFGLKPTLRLIREIRYMRREKLETLAERAEG